MALTAYIYKTKMFEEHDCTAGGFSSMYDGVCIMNIDCMAQVTPCDKYYPVLLKTDRIVKCCWVVPARQKLVAPIDEDEWVEDDIRMSAPFSRGSLSFGGNYCTCSDSRLGIYINKQIGIRFYGAIPIHDRIETSQMQNQ